MFVVFGLNQQTPLVYREQIAINATNLASSICQLQQLDGVDACTILSTCNRTEIYAKTEKPHQIIDWFKQHHQNIWPELEPYAYCHTDTEALVHALKVACGLDSMLIGEPQILGQVKHACHLAIDLGTMSDDFRNWFDFIFQMTKKIRTQSGISKHPISVASVAVDCIQMQFTNLLDKKILIIGSGETAKLAAIHLQERGCRHFFVTSRHLEHAKILANLLEGQALAITELNSFLHQVDIVVTATSCPFPFISQTAVAAALKERNYQPMVLVDLAVPRDIESEVGLLPEVHLINIDHLQQIQAQHQAERNRAGKVALHMIYDAIESYQKKQKSQSAQDVICDYRTHMKNLAQSEVERAHQKLDAGHCQYQVVKELSERLIQKLIHYPTVGIQQAACEDRHDLLELANYLFNPNRNETVTS